MKSLLHIIEERSGLFVDDALLQEVLSELLEDYPNLNQIHSDMDWWVFLEHQGNQIAVNAYKGTIESDDGYIRMTAYDAQNSDMVCNGDDVIGRTAFNLTMMQQAL